MKKLFIGLAALTVLISVVLVGCGANKDDMGTTTSTEASTTDRITTTQETSKDIGDEMSENGSITDSSTDTDTTVR